MTCMQALQRRLALVPTAETSNIAESTSTSLVGSGDGQRSSLCATGRKDPLRIWAGGCAPVGSGFTVLDTHAELNTPATGSQRRQITGEKYT